MGRRMGLYCMFDRIAEESHPVFESINDGTAMRAFRDAMSKGQGVDPADFWLLCVGHIDHTSSLIVPVIPPRQVVAAAVAPGAEDVGARLARLQGQAAENDPAARDELAQLRLELESQYRGYTEEVKVGGNGRPS